MFRDFNKYEVYDDGRIWSYKRNKFLKPYPDRNGYEIVTLSDNDGNLKKYLHHRVVYESVTGQPIPEHLQVNHIDEVKTNNHISNLNLMTCKENVNWGSARDRMIKAQSKKVEQYDMEGNLIQVWPSTREVERQLGYFEGGISMCCNGKCKQAYGFIWKYIT